MSHEATRTPMLPSDASAWQRIHRRVEHVMGMPISLALRGPHADSPTGARAWRAVVDELREVDSIFSTYRVDSCVSRLSWGEVTIEDCPQAVAEVLALGAEAERVSDGAFSVNLPDGSGGRRRLDPSGVVKGWAVQRASRLLARLVDTDFCLSAGGDLTCRVADPARPPWRIGVEDPAEPRRVLAVIPIRSGAVATSAATHRGAHVIDPRTGAPATGAASVTVVADDLTWADIDATAAYVHGAGAAEWLRTRPVRSALVVWPDGSTTTVRALVAPGRSPRVSGQGG